MKKFSYFLVAILFYLLSLPLQANAKFLSHDYKIVHDPQGVYVVEINTSKFKDKLKPVIVSELETNANLYKMLKPQIVVNAGFFDPKNQKTVSFVTINEQLVLNPNDNENLINNKVLTPYMDKILNRSEFRVLSDEKGKLIYDIASHNEPIKEGYKLKHSIQAGPMLLPELKLEDEFFILVRKGKIISESASSLHKYARTAIGIRNNNVYLFIITNENPMTLKEVAELAKQWGMEKAMAFDGGGSTSFDSKELHIISEKDNQARKLKSFLVLFK